MTSLKKLHAFCTKLEHYPSRLAIQQEIERLLAEEDSAENKRQDVIHFYKPGLLFPIIYYGKSPCGSEEPKRLVVMDWAIVTCSHCLKHAPGGFRI